MEQTQQTPLMQQYHTIKAQYQDTLLLFQVGDFYELFFDDAKQAASFLGIALTKRGKANGQDIPLCGVPIHVLDHYLHKLVKGGYKVALCDQLEEARPGTVVRRGVTRVLTPGTLTQPQLLDDKSASYLCSYVPMHNGYGLLFAELLTAQLFATYLPLGSERSLENELARFFPDEIIVPKATASLSVSHFKKLGYTVSPFEVDQQREHLEYEYTAWLHTQFNQETVDAFAQQEALRLAFFYFYAYIKRNNEAAIASFKSVQLYKPEDFLQIDRMTQHNLELVHNLQDNSHANTLFWVLDGAATPMGSRMIKKWLARPLINHEAIVQRQEVIAWLVQEISEHKKLQDTCASLGDIERVIGRIVLHRAHLHDFRALKDALAYIPRIRQLINNATESMPLMQVISQHIDDFTQLHTLLSAAINEDALNDWTIKAGFDAELDAMRALIIHGGQEIIGLERAEQKATGIASLKVRYNEIHGYYIETTKLGAAQVPSHYKRLQSLVGKERFTTAALELLQQNIERAKKEVNHKEVQLFDAIKKEIAKYYTRLRKLAHGLAHLDALNGLAQIAAHYGYVQPIFNTQGLIDIKQGRHPVVERQESARFIPNDTLLNDQQTMWIITGPNMGGKSTYLRQVALICIMAHIGSFVPAQSANIALLDRIFTRIGAGDNVAGGKSTFLTEMEETALICTQATKASLVILDEVGRGTSTIDGLSIAQAVVEYLVGGPRCLFATHYHELTQLSTVHPTIASYYAASTKTKDGILFLYTMVRGVADGSFGIEVAKLAKLPLTIVSRAYDLMAHHNKLHQKSQDHQLLTVTRQGPSEQFLQELEQLRAKLTSLDKQYARLIELCSRADSDNLTPRQALELVWQLKECISTLDQSNN